MGNPGVTIFLFGGMIVRIHGKTKSKKAAGDGKCFVCGRAEGRI